MIDPARKARSDKQMAMKQRTMAYATRVVLACRQVIRSFDGRHLAGQLIRCSTSVAANYRAACRARSRKEFAAKIGVVVEEADESLFWLELAQRTSVLPTGMIESLADEASQLVAIFSATRTRTLKPRTAGPSV
jgi:four helix bundle protein